MRGLVGEQSTKLARFLGRTPPRRQIIMKAVSASRARQAARKARELTRRKARSRALVSSGQARRLLLKQADLCELYIVEGDSAGGPPSRRVTAPTGRPCAAREDQQ
jgi:DNA gyrase subunit B